MSTERIRVGVIAGSRRPNSRSRAVGERGLRSLNRALDTLTRWTPALRSLRPETGDHPELADASRTARATAVTEQFVQRLQDGLDRGDADHYDSRFAPDVLWGSPYGQVLAGFTALNTAHRSMMSTPRPGHSRYEIVRAAMPADDLVVAHVRRRSLHSSPIGTADFSEMALYVLVERDGEWWLAAGQNTPIADKPEARS